MVEEYLALSDAIVEQAVIDWIKSDRIINRPYEDFHYNKLRGEAARKKTERKKRNAKETKEDVENFLLSDWMQKISYADGPEILEKLRKGEITLDR